MAELTRFDFHVHNFLNSEDVENMTADEVGQYFLLLCHAFVKGREASLPDEPVVLARYARAKRVSDLVMKKFPLVDTEWGPRRRNDPLYKEFLRAKSRSEGGRKAVAERWENEPSTEVIRPYNGAKTNVDTHTIPYQSIPNQTNQSSPSGFSPGNWKTLAIRFRGVLGKFISSTKTNKQKYSEFCNQFGEDKVLTVFNDWAEQNKSWVGEKDDPLFYFFKDLPDLVEAVASEKAQKEPEIASEQVTEIMEQDRAERQDRINTQLAKAAFDKAFEELHRDEI